MTENTTPYYVLAKGTLGITGEIDETYHYTNMNRDISHGWNIEHPLDMIIWAYLRGHPFTVGHRLGSRPDGQPYLRKVNVNCCCGTLHALYDAYGDLYGVNVNENKFQQCSKLLFRKGDFIPYNKFGCEIEWEDGIQLD